MRKNIFAWFSNKLSFYNIIVIVIPSSLMFLYVGVFCHNIFCSHIHIHIYMCAYIHIGMCVCIQLPQIFPSPGENFSLLFLEDTNL